MNHLLASAEVGRIAALAIAAARDLNRCMVLQSDVFVGRPFDPGMLHAIALANAAAAPGAAAADTLRVANRAALFVFALDWLVDTRMEDPAQVAAVVADCRAVAAGSAASTGLGRLLADIRSSLGATDFIDRWQVETERMIAAMEREQRWLADEPPTLLDYLDNADNTGMVFVTVSHWLYTADDLAWLDGLITAARAGQRVLRLVNDLATHERDIATGDLNVLAFVDRAAVDQLAAEAVTTFRQLLGAIEPHCPDQCALLSRQVGFATGFYEFADFWGDP